MDDFRARLREWAADLTGPVSNDPVIVREICAKLMVKLKRSPKVPKFKAFLAVDPSNNSASILLPAPKDPALANFERFCVAHELAHYFLLTRYGLLPSSVSQYWQHEDLCDDFARHLLVPDYFFDQLEIRSSIPAADHLDICEKLAERAQVPWMHAAIRISETVKEVAFLKCIHVVENRSRGGGNKISATKTFQEYYKVQKTSLPRQWGIGTRIKNDSPLFKSLDALTLAARALPRGKKRLSVRKNITSELEQSSLGGLFMLRKAACAEVFAGYNPEIRIACS